MILEMVLAGLVLLTTAAAVGALAVWHRTYRRYRRHMSGGGRVAMLSIPPLTVLAASPLLDLSMWLATGAFPTVGVAGPLLGAAGVVLAGACVFTDLRGPVSRGASERLSSDS